MSTNIATYPITYQQTDITPNNIFTNETIKQAVTLWFNNQNESNTRHGPISEWNTSEVTDMSELFSLKRLSENGISYNYRVLEYIFASDDPKSFYIGPNEKEKYNIPGFNDSLREIAPNFELDLNGWDTSNVTDMREMFYLQINLNPQLNQWKTSKVKNMSKMFYGATSFNQNLSKWDTSEVTDVSYMFFNAREFQNDPEIFTRFTVDMRTITDFAFTNSGLFNEPYLQFLSYGGDLKDFTFTIKDKENIFSISPNDNFASLMHSIKQKKNNNNNDLSLEEVITLNRFIQSIYLEKEWIYNNYQLILNVRRWIRAEGLEKEEIIQERGHISDWNISRVTSLEKLFMNTKDFNEDISRWNTYKVTNMDFTFYQAIKFNQDIGSKVINEGQYNEYTAWDVSNVTTANCMFSYSAFNQDISNWNIQNIVDKSFILNYAYNLEPKNVLFNNIRTLYRNEENNFKTYLNNSTIRHALELWNKDPNHYIFTNPNNQDNYYIGDISEWETELVTDMSYLFNFVSFPASSTNTTTTITNINNYFINLPDIEGWNVMSVTNMNNLFYDLQNNNENRQKLIGIFQSWFLGNLKYAHNLINNEYFKNIIEFSYSALKNLFTEVSEIAVRGNIDISIRRDKIFNEPLVRPADYTVYTIYNYNEANRERDIIYFYQNLASNINRDNYDFILNLNNNNRITTVFDNNVGEGLFSDGIDLGGFTKLLLFEPFVRFLYYDPKIITGRDTCEENKIKIEFCPFMLDNGELTINPNLKIAPTTGIENPDDVSINTIFGSVENFYIIVGLLLRKLITTPLRTPSGEDEYFKTYIPFGKILASLITGEIRLDDNSSFNETNNILNLIDHLEEIDRDFHDINEEHDDDNDDGDDDDDNDDDGDDDDSTSQSIYLDINFEKKLPFTEIKSTLGRNLAIRQRLNYLKGSYIQDVLNGYFPNVNFAKIYLGESEKKLIIFKYLCHNKNELFERFQYFYDSMIKINQNQTRFYDIYKNQIDNHNGHQYLSLSKNVTSMNLMNEFYCDINTDRRKFLQFIDGELNKPNIQNSQIRSNRLRMFKELIEIKDVNYINDETLIKLFIWFSGSTCFHTDSTIDFVGIALSRDGVLDPRSFLFRASTCSNQLNIPIYDYSEGFEYTNWRNEIFRGDIMTFPTDDAGNQRKYNYNKEKLREALRFSLDGI